MVERRAAEDRTDRVAVGAAAEGTAAAAEGAAAAAAEGEAIVSAIGEMMMAAATRED